MDDTKPHSPLPKTVIEFFKKFIDRAKLHECASLTVDQRLDSFQRMAAESPGKQRLISGPACPWMAISDCGPNRTTDPVTELYKQDVDRALLRESLRRTSDQRCQALVSMAQLVDELQG